MTPSPFIDYDLMPEFGYDWALAPAVQAKQEYRQLCSEAHLKWLEYWMPKVAH